MSHVALHGFPSRPRPLTPPPLSPRRPDVPRLHARLGVLLVLAVAVAHVVVVVIQQVGQLGRVERAGSLLLTQLSRGHCVVQTRRRLLPSVGDMVNSPGDHEAAGKGTKRLML